jgi:hypothetical protein
VRGKLDMADWMLQRQLISTLVKRVEIGEEEVRVAYRVDCGPFELAPFGGMCRIVGGVPAEPYPPVGEKEATKKGPYRPRADHPWRRGFRKQV